MHLEGVPIAVIAAWLGHTWSAFTMATYVALAGACAGRRSPQVGPRRHEFVAAEGH
jgi:hypothetical protein